MKEYKFTPKQHNYWTTLSP